MGKLDAGTMRDLNIEAFVDGMEHTYGENAMDLDASTGTALGDPIETSSIRTVFHTGMPVLTAAKATLGHGESPSGQTGLFKTSIAILGAAPGNAMLRVMNGIIRDTLASTRIALPLHCIGLQKSRVFSTSAFGFNGSIACAALRPTGAAPSHAPPARLRFRRPSVPIHSRATIKNMRELLAATGLMHHMQRFDDEGCARPLHARMQCAPTSARANCRYDNVQQLVEMTAMDLNELLTDELGLDATDATRIVSKLHAITNVG